MASQEDIESTIKFLRANQHEIASVLESTVEILGTIAQDQIRSSDHLMQLNNDAVKGVRRVLSNLNQPFPRV